MGSQVINEVANPIGAMPDRQRLAAPVVKEVNEEARQAQGELSGRRTPRLTEELFELFL